MSSTIETRNIMLDAVNITKIRIHSGATTDGTQNTIVDTDTNIAEIACTYGAAANAERDLTATVTIPKLPAGAIVSHFSLWDGTTYRMSKAFDQSETYTNAGGEANITSAKFTIADL